MKSCGLKSFCKYQKDVTPSPLDIEINEGLFTEVFRCETLISFRLKSLVDVTIRADGSIFSDGHIYLSPEQLNEIIRVRAALVWTGKE